MGGSSKQTSNSTTQTKVDPWQQDLNVETWNRAQNTYDQLARPYTGDLTASYDGTPMSQAQSGFSTLAGYNAPTVTAGQLSNTDLSPYFNQYTNDVVDATINQAMRAKGISDSNDAAKATAAGAFGGSRSAVLQSLNNNDWQQNLQSTLAGLNQQGYLNAQQAALQDINNRMSADTANQTADLNSANVRGNANSNLANLAQAQYGAQVDNLSRAYNAWLAQQQGLLSGQSLINSTLFGMQFPQTQTTNSQTETSQTPGLGQILGGLGSLAMGIGSGGLGFAPFAAGSGAAGAAGAGSMFSGGLSSNFTKPLSMGWA